MKIDLYYDDKEKTTKFKTLEEVPAVYGKELHFIPSGTISDGCSVPSWAWFICEALSGKYLKIFLKHDEGYRQHLMTRAEIDKEMLDDLLAEGMCPIKSYIIYFCVRLFGQPHWDRTKQS